MIVKDRSFANSTGDVDDLIKMVGGPPLVIKLIEGTQGVGVVLAKTKKGAASLIEAFMGVNANIIVQEFIKEAKGSDIRCLVVGDQVIAAMRRQGSPGEFRSNIHRGGTAMKLRLPLDYRRTALAAARVLGLRLAGVDMIESDDGPMVLEVNSSPGLEGIEKTTRIDVAAAVIEQIERDARVVTRRTAP